MPKKITSFSLDTEVLELLKKLADSDRRSMAGTIEILIIEAAAKKKIK